MLEIAFDDGARYKLPFEFLRVFSPSAEVRGHGAGQETLQVGKRNVLLTEVEPAGSYAIKLTFDDGHDSGLYTWEYLHELGQYQDAMWHDYLAQAGSGRRFARLIRTVTPAQAGVQSIKGTGFRPTPE